MHGRIPGVSWGESSQRLFHAFMQANVRKIIAEGGVGSVNHMLDPQDIVVVTDYIDFSMRRDVGLQEGYLSIMPGRSALPCTGPWSKRPGRLPLGESLTAASTW
ncbi:hypothetical protein [Moorella sulfitireducens (nom. illeg.)]|uniref:phosphorylase family protein n=1 Tax=Neomoorella sulfitireducens TaxID=2972948 RepID=UPI0030F41F6F